MKSIELFVGAGGLGMGVSAAGFKHELVVEWDEKACETLNHNRLRQGSEIASWPAAQSYDVRTLPFHDYEGKIDLISGGPPCQPFSLGGKHAGRLDPRDMFPEVVRAVREAKPKAILIENVKGLLRETFSSYFNYILLQFEFPELICGAEEDWLDHLSRLERHKTSKRTEDGLGYDVLFRSLDAANYGVAQRRERVFIVCLRKDLGLEWSFPNPTHSKQALLAQQVLTDDYWDKHRIGKDNRPVFQEDLKERLRAAQGTLDFSKLLPWQTVRDVICDLPDPIVAGDQGVPNHILVPGARPYAGHTGSLPDLPSKTIKAGSHGVPGGENSLVTDGGKLRYFTIREIARIQSFPDSFTFEGAWTRIMRQLGNAVPVTLAETVARTLHQLLETPKNQNIDLNEKSAEHRI